MLLRASATALPLADAQVDAALACLVLNFVPDSGAALREMRRVTAPGGRVAACVWDYAQRMELTSHYWAAAAALGLLAPGEAQSERYPICAPDALAAAFAGAGLAEVELAPLEIEMRFSGFDDYWQPFLAGQGVPPAHAMRLPEATRATVA